MQVQSDIGLISLTRFQTWEVNKLIDKFGVTFPNLRDDPRDIWGIDLPENVPTTYIMRIIKL